MAHSLTGVDTGVVIEELGDGQHLRGLVLFEERHDVALPLFSHAICRKRLMCYK